MRKIYQQIFGENWEESITNFIQSLAGYSLVQYLFQIKDRHNNNILIDTEGHVIHIDFSFILSSSPGNMNFERAPFKLTEDYIELMEGRNSDIFAHFRLLFFLGLKFLRKYKKEIMDTVVMMSHCEMKCFAKFNKEAMERRFHANATDEELEVIVDGIMDDAYSSYTTSNYDRYQWYTNFIYSWLYMYAIKGSSKSAYFLGLGVGGRGWVIWWSSWPSPPEISIDHDNEDQGQKGKGSPHH